MSSKQDKSATKVINAGRAKQWTGSAVNPPVVRASTIIFDSVAQMQQASTKRADAAPFYGRRGTSTHFAFQAAITELQGGAGTALYPSGAAAISGALLSFLRAGDHLLMVDSVYEPTRELCDTLLQGFGIDTSYYDPLIGENITSLIRPNTRVIFMESPGSITMEVQDVPALCRAAKAHNIMTMLDNTWATPLLCDPFSMGIDIVIHAATKYIAGHSDVMLGTATASAAYWRQLQQHSYLLGQCTSPDDIYLASRGLRTLSVRLKQHQHNAATVAAWLATRPEVDHIRHPAFDTCPGNACFQRDFNGSNGLFSVVLKHGSRTAINAMLDSLQHFKMGFSWGGYESLILAVNNIDRIRTATQWDKSKPLLRLHIGLEDPEDLIADLSHGFAQFHAHQASI
ncbi:cystathionine beta-lyase [Shewanella sp. NFH-SH190041]|uniref:cystathionine beta-lyase n=1 Tax=Shewanella sp. NFH-SH190041 TaxID=2950245 RepID=UPI0021C4AC1B|nr:cystathionine beta-lyase [Shewanella sp. NFH-SH190041]BDM64625.1 cystathionine beta-lyase [Shewanella sp. NFH-SH190041]